MISALIADDEKLSRITLSKMLELHCPHVEILAECDSANAAALLIRELNPQLLFLDVAMPGKSGIELLKELGDINTEVIFVTAHDKFVLQAIRLSAVDYLSKPVDEQELINAVANAAKRIETRNTGNNLRVFMQNIQLQAQQQEMQLCVPGIKGFQIIKIRDIIFCEADNTYTIIHLTDNKKILASRPLLDYETLLQDASFFRIHKSHLINMQHLKEYHKGEGGFVTMINGKMLEVSRRKKEQFVQYMKQHFKY